MLEKAGENLVLLRNTSSSKYNDKHYFKLREGGWTVNPVGNTGFVVDWSELESCTVQYSTTKRKDLLQAISKPGPGYFYIFCYKDISTKRGKDIFLIMRSG